MKAPNFALTTLPALMLMSLAATLPAQPAELPDGVRVIADGFKFPEGPAIGPEGDLYFSDVWGHTIYRWDGESVEPVAEETQGGNGLAFAADGTLYACAGDGGALLKIMPDGEKSACVSEVDGQPLNSPNDVVIHPSGNIYFTNPAGFAGAKEGHTPVSVVLVRPDGSASIASSGVVSYPNGIAFSPDHKTLYVNDFLGGSRVMKFPVNEDGTLGEASEVIRFGGGGPDGLAVTASGNLYVALNLAAKVVKLSPEGEQLDEIVFPKASGVTNLCFGGPEMKTLYITLAGGQRKVVAVEVDEPGLPLVGQQ